MNGDNGKGGGLLVALGGGDGEKPEPDLNGASDTNNVDTVPVDMLAMPDEQEQMQPPEVGDEVNYQVAGKVVAIEGGMAKIQRTSINGQDVKDNDNDEDETNGGDGGNADPADGQGLRDQAGGMGMMLVAMLLALFFAFAPAAQAQPYNSTYTVPPYGAAYHGSDPMHSLPFFSNTIPAGQTYYVLQASGDYIYSDATNGTDALQGPGMFSPRYSTVYQATATRSSGQSVTNLIFDGSKTYFGSFNGRITLARANTLYVTKTGNDASGARGVMGAPFLTITAALNAAQPGDTVDIGPGSYNENNLLRPGVNLYFETGAGIHYMPSATNIDGLGAFDDRLIPGGSTNHIYGNPDIFYCTGIQSNSMAGTQQSFDTSGQYVIWWVGSTNCLGAINITNKNSVFIADLGTLTFAEFTQFQYAAINIFACTYCDIHMKQLLNGSTQVGLTVVDDAVTGAPITLLTTNVDPSFSVPIVLQDQTSGVFWNYGETHITCGYLDFLAHYGIYCWQSAVLTNEQNFYYNGDVIRSKIYVNSAYPSANYLVNWFRFSKMDMPTNTFDSPLTFFAGKNYVTFQKIFIAGGGPPVNLSAGGNNTYNYVWLDGQKITACKGSAWLQSSTTGSTPVTCIARVQHWENSDNSAQPIGGIVNNGTTIYIENGDMFVPDGIGIWHTNGATTVLNGFRVDCSAGSHTNDWPAVVSGTGFEANNSYLKAPASTYSMFSRTTPVVTLAKTATNQPSAAVVVTSY